MEQEHSQLHDLVEAAETVKLVAEVATEIPDVWADLPPAVPEVQALER